MFKLDSSYSMFYACLVVGAVQLVGVLPTSTPLHVEEPARLKRAVETSGPHLTA